MILPNHRQWNRMLKKILKLLAKLIKSKPKQRMKKNLMRCRRHVTVKTKMKKIREPWMPTRLLKTIKKPRKHKKKLMKNKNLASPKRAFQETNKMKLLPAVLPFRITKRTKRISHWKKQLKKKKNQFHLHKMMPKRCQRKEQRRLLLLKQANLRTARSMSRNHTKWKQTKKRNQTRLPKNCKRRSQLKVKNRLLWIPLEGRLEKSQAQQNPPSPTATNPQPKVKRKMMKLLVWIQLLQMQTMSQKKVKKPQSMIPIRRSRKRVKQHQRLQKKSCWQQKHQCLRRIQVHLQIQVAKIRLFLPPPAKFEFVESTSKTNTVKRCRLQKHQFLRIQVHLQMQVAKIRPFLHPPPKQFEFVEREENPQLQEEAMKEGEMKEPMTKLLLRE
mmetsp:Transcript_7142/g.16726  ORF Transcript_7142/g.16726 Transcript_7142/m.16726 type:complete len:385 (+) Transcript_7142:633-1787(+)